MNKQSTNSNCRFYNFGGDGTIERPTYPTAYGARCELYNEFFRCNSKGIIYPNCPTCEYEKNDGDIVDE
jgi:hypothetical protein